MVRPLQLESLGGYIPFVDLPCERDIGEALVWVVVLSALPWNCKIVPWLCCPLPFDPNRTEIAISTDISCDDPRAPIGGMIHWSMVAISILGLITSLISLGECAMVVTNVLPQEIPTSIVFDLEDPDAKPDIFTVWFDNFEKTLQDFQKNYLKYPTNFDPDHSLIINLADEGIHTNIAKVIQDVAGQTSVSKTAVETTPEEQIRQIALTLRNLTSPGEAQEPPGAAVSSRESHASSSPNVHLHYKKTSPQPVYVDASSLGLAPSKRKGKKVSRRSVEDFINTADRKVLSRMRRQTRLDVPIPVSPSFYAGRDDATDSDCGRNQVKVDDDDDDEDDNAGGGAADDDDDDDDECYDVLSRGPCDEKEIVLVDPVTRKGFCGPRLCSPDRVFLYSDQLCHDPHEIGLCPPGRQLFTSGFGTPVCGCEDGFYEQEDDDDDNVCRPLLTEIPSCDPGKVFWFKSFRDPPKCLPDPCKGLNLNRKYSYLPYAPALRDGKCYQLGSRPKFCRSNEYFTLDLTKLHGVCQSLEDAGYLTLDSSTLEAFKEAFGSPLSKNDAPVTPLPLNFKSRHAAPALFPPTNWNSWDSRSNSGFPVIGSSVVPGIPSAGGKGSYRPPLVIGQSVVSRGGSKSRNSWPQQVLTPTHVTAHSVPYIAVDGNVTINVFGRTDIKIHKEQQKTASSDREQHPKSRGRPQQQLLSFPPLAAASKHRRSKRAPQPHASPSNVFEPALAACRAGAARDINQKCRDTLLPGRVPHSRPRRATRPVPASPSCPNGGVRSIQRRCTSSLGSVQSSIIAMGLG